MSTTDITLTLKNEEDAEEKERIFKSYEGKFVSYNNQVGRIKRYEDGYIFKKKNAKKYAYRITPMDICVNVVV